jgi:hypothetical protein
MADEIRSLTLEEIDRKKRKEYAEALSSTFSLEDLDALLDKSEDTQEFIRRKRERVLADRVFSLEVKQGKDGAVMIKGICATDYLDGGTLIPVKVISPINLQFTEKGSEEITLKQLVELLEKESE